MTNKSYLSTYLVRLIRLSLFLGLCFVLIYRTIRSGMVYEQTNYQCFVFLLFLFLLGVFGFIIQGKVNLPKTSLHILHFLFFVVFAFSWLMAPDKMMPINQFLNFGSAILSFYIVLFFLNDEREIVGLVWMILLIGACVSLLGLYQYFFGLDETRAFVAENLDLSQFSSSFQSRLNSNRIFSTFVYPNVLAGYLLMLFPFLLYLFKRSWFKFHLSLIVSISFIACIIFYLFEKVEWIPYQILGAIFYPILFVICFMLTLSKGALVTLIGLSLIMIVWEWRDRIKKGYLFLSILVFNTVMVTMAIVLKPDWLERAWLSLKVRIEYWESSLEIIKNYFWWGVGPGFFGSIFARYKVLGGEETQLAHQNYMQIAAEIGIIAIILCCLIWSIPLINAFRKPSQQFRLLQSASVLAVVAFLIHSLMDFDLYEPAIAMLLWVFLAFIIITTPGENKFRVFYIQSFSKKLLILVLSITLFSLTLMLLIFPYKAGQYHRDAILFDQKHQTQEALFAAKRSLLYFPWFSKGEYLLAALAEKSGDFSSALKHLKVAAEYNPYHPIFFYKQARILGRMSGYQDPQINNEMTLLYERAYQNYPNSVKYTKVLAMHYKALGQDERYLEMMAHGVAIKDRENEPDR